MITMTDFFCGAGGSSTGAVSTGAVEVTLASNHWTKAIEVHAANHPRTDHRMLEPHEIAAGMAFPTDYQWQGNKRERVRMAGNAVCPPAARDLVTVVAEALERAA